MPSQLRSDACHHTASYCSANEPRIAVIAAGYMAKRVVARPDWINAGQVADIYSISRHVSDDFADYINYWKHNGYWLFDSPHIIAALAKDKAIELNGTKLFFYEVYEYDFYDEAKGWKRFAPEASLETRVLPPIQSTLEGFDVVTFSVRTCPECSPLSCNSFATKIATNEHCLLGSLEDARRLLETGKFDDSEPGPFRIFAVYSTDWPSGSNLKQTPLLAHQAG